jgi:hypothetical protein
MDKGEIEAESNRKSLFEKKKKMMRNLSSVVSREMIPREITWKEEKRKSKRSAFLRLKEEEEFLYFFASLSGSMVL